MTDLERLLREAIAKREGQAAPPQQAPAEASVCPRCRQPRPTFKPTEWD